MTPIAGIELDDGSHKQAKREQRDTFVDQVFAAAGLLLFSFTFQVKHTYC
ncbi:MAG: DUF2726 domain-containing protein [Anaerolineae bacterium]|nr:DUF2726 domain-containing protein [Anaerolineae bacterium]